MKYACVFLLFVSVSCADPGPDAATIACYDFAEVFGRAAEACGYPYDDNRDAIIDGLFGCGHYTSIRDEALFRGECFEWIRTRTCSQLNNPNFAIDASCTDQLRAPVSRGRSALEATDASVETNATLPLCAETVVEEIAP